MVSFSSVAQSIRSSAANFREGVAEAGRSARNAFSRGVASVAASFARENRDAFVNSTPPVSPRNSIVSQNTAGNVATTNTNLSFLDLIARMAVRDVINGEISNLRGEIASKYQEMRDLVEYADLNEYQRSQILTVAEQFISLLEDCNKLSDEFNGLNGLNGFNEFNAFNAFNENDPAINRAADVLNPLRQEFQEAANTFEVLKSQVSGHQAPNVAGPSNPENIS